MSHEDSEDLKFECGNCGQRYAEEPAYCSACGYGRLNEEDD